MPDPTEKPITPARLVVTIVYLLFWPALLFLVAGDWRWVEGWLFSGWFVAICVITIVWLYRKDPALLAERYRRPGSGGQKGWDTVIVYLLGVGFLVWMVIMPLDARRLGWTGHWPLALEALGLAMLLGASFFLFRAFTDNPFLSPLVRIQSERKQQVVSTGVYGFVRHPMYLGAILMMVGGPLLLGASRGLIVGAALSLVLAVRIVGEEKVLRRELEGYDAYRQKVRYRLFPRIW
jgi:protein-S-isoprenylcysteine O-methyltransferase Ste14